MYHRHTLAAIIACPVVCPNLLRDYISTRVLLRQVPKVCTEPSGRGRSTELSPPHAFSPR
eukprot:scaffold15712_cov67-Phaeocystis_antarctica.AAC.5